MKLASGIREAMVWAREVRRWYPQSNLQSDTFRGMGSWSTPVLDRHPHRCPQYLMHLVVPMPHLRNDGFGIVGVAQGRCLHHQKGKALHLHRVLPNLTSYFEWDHSTSRGNRCFGNLRKQSGCNKLPRWVLIHFYIHYLFTLLSEFIFPFVDEIYFQIPISCNFYSASPSSLIDYSNLFFLLWRLYKIEISVQICFLYFGVFVRLFDRLDFYSYLFFFCYGIFSRRLIIWIFSLNLFSFVFFFVWSYSNLA